MHQKEMKEACRKEDGFGESSVKEAIVGTDKKRSDAQCEATSMVLHPTRIPSQENSVQTSLIPENQKKESSITSEPVLNGISVFSGIEKTAAILASKLSVVLNEALEELHSSHLEFRGVLQTTFFKILAAAHSQVDSIIIFNEAVPGYTLMLFKKNPLAMQKTISKKEESAYIAQKPEPSSSTFRACTILADQYFKRTGNKVLSVESQDALFAFFPVEDIKKNLKELGFDLCKGGPSQMHYTDD